MSLDVLFVDDDYDLANEWASYVAELLSVTTSATGSSEEALEIVKSTGVKIAVLDQRMEGQTFGLELGREMHTTDSRLKLILLSGQAKVADVQRAYNTVFCRVIHKNEGLDELPDELSRQLLEYRMALQAELRLASNALVRSTPLSWLLQRQLAYKFLKIDHIDDQEAYS